MAFWKKNCRKCGKKIEKGFSYCPHCGLPLEKEREERDYGFLGRNDRERIDPFRQEIKLPPRPPAPPPSQSRAIPRPPRPPPPKKK